MCDCTKELPIPSQLKTIFNVAQLIELISQTQYVRTFTPLY